MKKKRRKTQMQQAALSPLAQQIQTIQPLPASFGSRDDLTVIAGIDPVIEMALNSIGIRKLADFGGYTPQNLSQDLHERTGLAISAGDIERQNWIVSAELLAGASASPIAIEVEDEATTEEAAIHSQEQNDGGPAPDALETPAPILPAAQDSARAGAVEEAIASASERCVEPSAEAAGGEEMALRIQAVRFEILETPATDEALPETRLRSEMSCELAGPNGPASTIDEIFLCAQIYAVDTANGRCALLDFQSERLQPLRTDYRLRLEFKVPDAGNYRLHLVAFLLHPVAKVAFYQGPLLRVLP
jgi:predicted flap endonuclease-1-like 5' DNA nuclease